MSLVTKTIDSRILGKEMNLAVYHPAVNDSSACQFCISFLEEQETKAFFSGLERRRQQMP